MAAEPLNRDTWEQWAWVWPVLAYGLLVLHGMIAWNNDLRNGPLWVVFVFTGLLGLWYLPFIRAGWPTAVDWRAGLYQGLGWALWVVLIFLHPAAFMLAGVFYPLLFVHLSMRPAIASALILAAILFVVALLVFQLEAQWRPTLFLVAVLLFASSVILGLFIQALIRQSQERQQLVEELTQTRADLLRIEREAGMLAERQRLAREIHDTLAQDFTSIIMHLTAAKLSEPTAVHAHLQQAEQTAREGLDEARRMVWASRPQQLEYASLAENLERLAARFSVEHGVGHRTGHKTVVQTAVTGPPIPLTPEKDAALLRIAQEALHNVRKHAQARSVTITLSYMSDLVVLDIVDDGLGFTPDSIDTHGFGLKFMRERATELGGALDIESAPGRGTAVAVSLPVEKL